jgi:hypothetical protein
MMGLSRSYGQLAKLICNLGTSVSLRHLSRIVVSQEYHCKFRLPTVGIMQLACEAASLAQRLPFH